MIPFALVGIRHDQKPMKWVIFFPLGILTFSLMYLSYVHRDTLESLFLEQYFPSFNLKWNWNELFGRIPLNNGWLFRLYQPHWLTAYLSFVYRSAFYMNLWVGVMRGFFAKDIKKMIRYMMAGIVLQLVIIYPFYYSVLLQEVWFVQGVPDLLNRHYANPETLLGVVKDCFPSMHTSTAFAVLLLALREKSKWFKWLMVLDCASIIYATLYLRIHWVLDVIAGMLLAYATVQFVNWVLDRVLPKTLAPLWIKWFSKSSS